MTCKSQFSVVFCDTFFVGYINRKVFNLFCNKVFGPIYKSEIFQFTNSTTNYAIQIIFHTRGLEKIILICYIYICLVCETHVLLFDLQTGKYPIYKLKKLCQK